MCESCLCMHVRVGRILEPIVRIAIRGAHGPRVSGGTEALNQSSGFTGGHSFVDTVRGGADLAQY